MDEKINSNLKEAEGLNLNSTPTLYLNGKKLELDGTYEDLKAKISDALK